jgi:hypothetical protein
MKTMEFILSQLQRLGDDISKICPDQLWMTISNKIINNNNNKGKVKR